MVCGKGPSIGRKAKQAAKGLEKSVKKIGFDKIASFVIPGMGGPLGPMMKGALAGEEIPGGEGAIPSGQIAGFTEEQKKQLRRRRGFSATRLTGPRGLLAEDQSNLKRPSLFGV